MVDLPKVARIYAAVVGLAWVPWRLGLIVLPGAFSPALWLTHELLFAVGGALPAGKARHPHLVVALWLLGRAAVYGAETLGPLATAAALLAFPVAALACAEGPRCWVLALLTIGQTAFLWEVWRYDAGDLGLTLGLIAAGGWVLSGRGGDRLTGWTAVALGAATAAAGWATGDRYLSAAADEVWLWGLVAALLISAPGRFNRRRAAAVLVTVAPTVLALEPGWILVLAPAAGLLWVAVNQTMH
jgi:hypothetical protein